MGSVLVPNIDGIDGGLKVIIAETRQKMVQTRTFPVIPANGEKMLRDRAKGGKEERKKGRKEDRKIGI